MTSLPADAAATAGMTAAPADGMEFILTPLLTDEEFGRLWMKGLGSEKGRRRTSDWDDVADDWRSFSYKFQKWLSGMPGDVDSLMNETAIAKHPLVYATFSARQRVMASGIMRALKALMDER